MASPWLPISTASPSFNPQRAATTTKPKTSSDGTWTLPKETPAQKAARLRKLRAILKKGTGLQPGELSKAIRPGYLETYRAMEDPAPDGRRRSRR